MITIEGPWNYVGLGNHFFMYSYMRLLSEKLDYKLVTRPITFSERGDTNHQSLVYSFKNKIYGIDNTTNEKQWIDDGFSHRFETIDNTVDYFIDKNYHIVGNGYFQKYSYWKKYKGTVKQYFNDFTSTEKKSETDIAIHLRNSYQDPTFKLNDDFYLKSLEKFQNGKVYVFADNFNRHNELLNKLKEYNPIIMDLNVQDTLKEITKFNNIICSQGSFSFWCSFLSDANKIIFPITKKGPNQLDSWSINYIVDDEERYEWLYY